MRFKSLFGSLLSKALIPILLVVISPELNCFCNNIKVKNTQLTGKNTTDDYSLVQFDIDWENSWRCDISGAGQMSPNNWDAAWVFIKYRVSGGAWQHAWLNNSGHNAPAGSTISIGMLTPGQPFAATTNPGLGAFIFRNANGNGTFSQTGVQIRWNYGANGVADNDPVDIQVFAIEMVYVPEGTFSVGTGGTETCSFTNGPWSPGATIPLSISSENAITIDNKAGNLWGITTGTKSTIGPIGVLAAAFPKGFSAFYCMKYEISQQGYVDFLNSLTRTQQDMRTGTVLSDTTSAVTNSYVMSSSPAVIEGNFIRCDGTIQADSPINFYCDYNGNGMGGEANDGQNIACGYIKWNDLVAYLDWSGLRPMTELEYEKACRGTATPIPDEYAWGSKNIFMNTGVINRGADNEASSNNGNCSYGKIVEINGPIRVGAFATSNSTRVSSGASFYGIMEMNGNVWESVVTVGTLTGRVFTGIGGNGSLKTDGDADVANWPVASTVTSPVGNGIRGGSWRGLGTNFAVSSRGSAIATEITRESYTGGRGVRCAN